ncbi:MAG: oligosaccharide flippase family protein [Fibrobacter sp.]|jgi:PST family polysaccharide transporter|nr:oligosaccharide flippase family protein [Fibrobacter sp.]
MRGFFTLNKAFLSSLVVFTRISLLFISNKVLAVFLGPAVYAIVGQFQNLMTVMHAGASLGLQNAWVSLTAEFSKDTSKRLALWRAGLHLSFFSLAAVSLLLIFLSWSGFLSFLFPTLSEKTLRLLLLCTIPGVASMLLITIVQSILNGLSAFKLWAKVSIGVSLVQSLWLISFVLWKFNSVLWALATQSLLSLLFLFIYLYRKIPIKKLLESKSASLKEWTNFIWMGLVPMILTPIVLSLVRSFVGHTLGWDQAGLWQGAFRISDFFSLIVSSILGVLILPQLSKLKNEKAFYNTLWRSLTCVFIFSFLSISFFYAFKTILIQWVLSSSFLPIADQIQIQWIGDFFRSGSWCLGLALMVKQETKIFILFEFITQIIFLSFTYFGLSSLKMAAPFWAYAIENMTGFLLMFFFLLRSHYLWKKKF